ncbi:MAG: patatin-like phospholipase family protein [Bryobacteraceae bacterium]
MTHNDGSERVGLVLSGGGARAAYEVGVLKAIYGGRCPAAQGQCPPEVFCGTGAGAFNAAVIAGRLPLQFPSPVGYLESLWADEIPREGLMRHNRVFRRRLDTLQFLDLAYMWRRPLKSWVEYFGDLALLAPEFARRTFKALARANFSSWLDLSIWHDTAPMLRLIRESVNLGVIRDGEDDLPPKRILRVIATERGAGRPHIFTNADFTEENGYAAILASCALPIIFPSVSIHGREFLYGGLTMQTPLAPAVEAGCTVIHLMHNEPRTERRLEGEDPNTRAMLNRTIALALSAALEGDLERQRQANEIARTFDRVRRETNIDVASYLNETERYRRVTVHQYRPTETLGGKKGLLSFSRENIERAIAAGERDASRHDCAENGCIV